MNARDYDQKFYRCKELVKLIPGEITQREFFFSQSCNSIANAGWGVIVNKKSLKG